MALFFFDIDDGKYSTIDPEGMEFADREAARHAAVAALAGIARDELPNGENCSFKAVIRDSAGRAIFEARLEFTSRWFQES